MTSRSPISNVAGWPEVTIRNITTKVGSGATPRGGADTYLPERVEYALVRSQNVLDRRFDPDGLAYITSEQAHALRGVLLQPDDVLLNITGDGDTFGRSCIVPESVRPACVNQHVAIVRVDPDRANPGYVLAYLTHPAVKPYIASFNAGGSRRAVTKGHIESFRIPLPPLDVQHVIGRVLGTLDAKIETNRRLAQVVPELIRARVLSSLSDDGVSVPVAQLAKFVNGGAYTKGATGSGRMVIRIADLNSGPGSSTVYNDIDVPDDKTARSGDILMSWSGSLGVYRWALDEAIVNQHIFKVLPKGYPAWLVFDRLDAVIHIFQSVAKDKATTMGHIQRGHLETTEVEVPSTAALAQLERELRPVWDRLLVAEQETLRLLRLRDALLPALLSGRIGGYDVSHVLNEAIV